MKKLKFFALLIATAVTGTVGLTACSSSDETAADVNPTYDGTSVRTDFAFNITKASQTTRMSAVNVQESNNFLGMKNMFLLPFKGVPGGDATPIYNTESSPKNYPLGSLTSTEIVTENSKKIYSLTIPVGTDNFLFYAKAVRNGSSTNFAQGRLSSSFFDAEGNIITTGATKAQDVNSTDQIHFDLTSIATSLGDDATSIASYLTAIANAQYTDDENNTTTWAQTVNKVAEGDGTYASLADIYIKFTKQIVDYSGSVESVQRLVFELYKSAYTINTQSPVQTVKNVAKSICTAIENNSGTVKLGVKASSSDDANTITIEGTGVDVTKANEWVGTLSGVDAAFPSNLNLPKGAALIKWIDGEKKFVYVDNPLYAQDINTVSSTTTPSTYCYPAELVYFDNSPLIATAQYKTENDYPSTTLNWDAALGDANAFTADWSQTSVAIDTRAVAMRNNVNYGVALLETTVALSDGVTALTDNRKTITGGDDQSDLKPSEFSISGLLIGGQPASVDWNMVNPDDAFNKVIYDKDVVTFTSKNLQQLTTNDKNYTVVLDNYCDGDGDQKNVVIALELVNNGKEFYGANGLIPSGSTFYLLGTLDLSTSGLADHDIPEIRTSVKRNAEESTYRITQEGTKRVFIQDYKTKVNLTISREALKKAYSIIPDLRSTEVLFGLSVDLKWESGLTFNVEL